MVMSLARLDRFYHFKHHFNVFKTCAMMPVRFSAHALVLCNVFITNVKPKCAFWHFNTAQLCDTHFKEVFGFYWKIF